MAVDGLNGKNRLAHLLIHESQYAPLVHTLLLPPTSPSGRPGSPGGGLPRMHHLAWTVAMRRAGTAEDDVEELARVPEDWKGEDEEDKGGGHGGWEEV